ncbi:MAG TPA: VOC family protein, partial [Geminicoccaceae bacterium]|nr:VOC family protein [Geminicoccaceae bacterium]
AAGREQRRGRRRRLAVRLRGDFGLNGAAVPAAEASAADATFLDHVGLFVPDRARAASALERLGFALTPFTPQRHTLTSGELVPAGTANRLAVLRQGYIEILTAIGETPLAAQMRQATGRYAGAHLIAFGTADAEGTHARLAEQGFAPLPLVRLQRAAATLAGERVARFSVVRVPPDRMPEGRMQFCRHHTPELVWQPHQQRHPNGAHALTDILLCVADVAEAAARYARFVGRPAQAREGFRLIELGRGRLHLFEPPQLRAATGIEAPTTPFIAGFALTTADLAATRALLTERGAPIRPLAPDVIAAAPDAIATTILLTEFDANLPWL